jgi:Transcriptional repressor TCF25
MSSRAIRALRGDAALLPPAIPGTVEEDESDDDDDEPTVARPRKVFAVLNNDDDSSSSSHESDDESSSSSQGANDDQQQEPDDPVLEGCINDAPLTPLEQPEEDLDALLAEFQVIDEVTTKTMASTTTGALEDAMADHRSSPYDLILTNFDARHLDYDFAMRMAASFSSSHNAAGSNNNNNNNSARPVSFGPPLSDWRRPPRLVGGGIGMTTYRLDPRPLPAPYNEDTDTASTTEWFTFVHSDTVQRDMEDFRLIQQSGDLTALGMFLSHHPYVAEGLLQYSSVLYQTNRIFEGMSLLKRTLYLFESSALSSFWDRLGRGQVCLVDYDVLENQQFFRALFRLVQVSHTAGYVRYQLYEVVAY